MTGNQTSGVFPETWTYAFDYENRLVAAQSTSGLTGSYVFDYDSKRIRKTMAPAGGGAPGTQYFLHDGDDIIGDYADNFGAIGSLTTSYVNGVAIDSKLARIDRDPVGQVPGYPPADLTWHYYHYDALGSVVSVTGGGATGNDPAAPPENQYHTNGWGEDLRKLEVLPGEFVDLVEHGSANILVDRYGFTGRERDEETRLMHYRRRTYDPRTGRFLQKDPGGMPEGPNRYTYVRSNPLALVDPFGLDEVRENPAASKSWFERAGGGFISGVWKVTTEPFKAAADVVTGTATAIMGIDLKDVQFSSMSANATKDSRLKGKSVTEALVDGYGRMGANIVTGGAYGTIQANIEIWKAVHEKKTTVREAEEALWEVAGGQTAAVVIAKIVKSRLEKAKQQAKTAGLEQTKPPAIAPQAGKAPQSIQEILQNPEALRGLKLADLNNVANKAGEAVWRIETLGRGEHKGQGWVLREYTADGRTTGRIIRYHPGEGHHSADPYWRVSSPEYGKSAIIPAAKE